MLTRYVLSRPRNGYPVLGVRFRKSGDSQDRSDIEVLIQVIGQFIERGVDGLVEIEPAVGPRPQSGEEGVAKRIGGKQSVEVAAEGAAVG